MFPTPIPSGSTQYLSLEHLLRKILVNAAVPLQMGCGTLTPASSLTLSPGREIPVHGVSSLSVASCVYPFLTYNQAKMRK